LRGSGGQTHGLTALERQIFENIGAGQTRKEVAFDVGIAVVTVRFLQARAIKRLLRYLRPAGSGMQVLASIGSNTRPARRRGGRRSLASNPRAGRIMSEEGPAQPRQGAERRLRPNENGRKWRPDDQTPMTGNFAQLEWRL